MTKREDEEAGLPVNREGETGEPRIYSAVPRADEMEPAEEEEPSDGRAMTFLDHLEDLRWTLVKSVAAFFIAAFVILAFITQFSELLQWPYNFATAGRDLQMSGLINTSILGVFSVLFYLMLGGGFSLAFPAILFFVAQFVAPGLTKREVRVLAPGCIAAFILFLSGCAFSFFILFPAALRGSIIFNEMLGFEVFWTAASYYGFMTWMVLGVGAAFEFPLVLTLLVYVGILNTEQLRAFRRYSWVLFLCIAAIVTPTTDPVTFLLLAAPLSGLYEVAIIAGRWVERRLQARADDDEFEMGE